MSIASSIARGIAGPIGRGLIPADAIPDLLRQNLLDSAQYLPGGWLFGLHSRDSGGMVRNANGNVVWAPENLLDGSEGPTVYWTLTGVTHVLTGETYEGRVVHELTKTSAAGVNGYVRDHGQNGTLSENSRLYLSAKFEKTESPLIASIYFTNQGVASYYVELDLSDGNITGANGTGGNHEVTDDGDWWLVRTPVENVGGTGSDFFSIRFDPDEDTGAVLRFTQPMVSRGGVHEYIPSSGGNPTFTPRLQHDIAGNPDYYLHEPQATKLRTWRAEDFTVTGTGSVTADAGTAPNGEDVAAEFHAVGGTDTCDANGVTASQSAGQFVVSAYVKRVDWDHWRFQLVGGANRHLLNGWLDLGSGTAGATASGGSVSSPTATSCRITEEANGWYRFELTGDFAFPTTDYLTLRIMSATGDGIVTRETDVRLLFWCAELEPGDRATSPVDGDGGEVVRQDDDLSAFSASIIGLDGRTEFSLFAEAVPLGDGDTVSLLNVASNNRALGSYSVGFATGSITYTPRVNAYGDPVSNWQNEYNVNGASEAYGDTLKVAARFQPDDCRGAINGTLGVVDDGSSYINPAIEDVGVMRAPNNSAGGGPTDAPIGIRQLRIIPRGLSDSELQNLTS